MNFVDAGISKLPLPLPLQKACFCMTVRNGAISAGASQILTGLINLPMDILFLDIAAVVGHVILAILGALLVFAILQNQPRLLEAWLLIQGFFLIITPLLIWLFLEEGIFWMIAFIIYNFFVLGYCWLVVYSHYKTADSGPVAPPGVPDPAMQEKGFEADPNAAMTY